MARTKTDIANLALISLGLGTVTDIDQPDSSSSQVLQAVYDECRRYVLGEAFWSFAVMSEAFTYDEVKGGYQVPFNCITVIGEMDGNEPNPFFHTRMINGALQLYRSEGDFVLNYPVRGGRDLLFVKDIETVGSYSPGFITCLRDYIASTIAVSATGSIEKKMYCESAYNASLSKAVLRECLQFKPKVYRRGVPTFERRGVL